MNFACKFPIIKENNLLIIFTGSATESNNLALKGVAFAALGLGNEIFSRLNPLLSGGAHSPQKNLLSRPHIIISSIEHPCIIESAKWLEKQGLEITKLPVDKFGFVNPEDVKKSITSKTISPSGRFRITLSPVFLFINTLAMGDRKEIFPLDISASSTPVI